MFKLLHFYGLCTTILTELVHTMIFRIDLLFDSGFTESPTCPHVSQKAIFNAEKLCLSGEAKNGYLQGKPGSHSDSLW